MNRKGGNTSRGLQEFVEERKTQGLSSEISIICQNFKSIVYVRSP